MQQLAQKVMTGYKDYIIGNGILGLDKISFDQYLASDQFQQLMKDSMGSLIDTTALQEQFTAAMQQVMGSMMENFSNRSPPDCRPSWALPWSRPWARSARTCRAR